MKKVIHIPVLLNEVLEVSETSINGWKIDCTIGGGGHFFALLKNTTNLLGFDADPKVIKNITTLLQNSGFEIKEKTTKTTFFFHHGSNKEAILVNDNFNNLNTVCKELSINKISLVLADLGLNMIQLKQEKRGFSFHDGSASLDMRLDDSLQIPTAADLVNGLGDKELTSLFRKFGNVARAKLYADKIKKYKQKKPIQTVADLLSAIDLNRDFPGMKIHPATQVFMALRIAVNSEFENLKNLLEQSFEFTKNGAKILIISFHSSEQRIIEQFAKEHSLQLKKTKPSIEEIKKNSSSRSATLNILNKYD